MFFEQPVLLNALDDLGDEDVAAVRQSAVLDEKEAAADCDNQVVRSEEGLSGIQCLIEHLRDGDYVLIGDKAAVLFGPQLHRNPFGEACPIDL